MHNMRIIITAASRGLVLQQQPAKSASLIVLARSPRRGRQAHAANTPARYRPWEPQHEQLLPAATYYYADDRCYLEQNIIR